MEQSERRHSSRRRNFRWIRVEAWSNHELGELEEWWSAGFEQTGRGPGDVFFKGYHLWANQESKNQESSSLEEPPLWDYVSKIEKQGGGGTWKFKCNLCNEIRQGSYPRFRAHLLGIKGSGISICKKATTGDKLEMKRLEDTYKEKKSESKSKEVELPCESSVGFKKRKVIQDYLRMKCLRRFFPNDDEYRRVIDEYAMFSMKSGTFEDLTSIEHKDTMEPKNWWVNFDAQTPFLQALAFRLLGQSSSSSCVERNWSTYAFIHSLRRKNLTTSRAQYLVHGRSKCYNASLLVWGGCRNCHCQLSLENRLEVSNTVVPKVARSCMSQSGQHYLTLARYWLACTIVQGSCMARHYLVSRSCKFMHGRARVSTTMLGLGTACVGSGVGLL
ncbi:hypothetical protein E3N88_39177 [Mikania micrantha]|uniref:HAT C-terminal dimerisation domain-containing protein n=1 Tax=Mikania micrantha TaxID=192012 RepID=A0A5N6LW93_9ASTR|nr:hypothetical protein E3N88_39177 [Mikania micrantha]